MLTKIDKTDRNLLEFTVNFEMTISENDIATVRSLQPVDACKWIMEAYNVRLFDANCIRKALTQHTYDFDLGLGNLVRKGE